MMKMISGAWSAFADSVENWWGRFSFSTVVMAIMMIFMLVGLVDKLRGNRKGYGAAFDEAFATMGPLALAMVGAISMAPVLCKWLSPVVAPVFKAFGASPAMFAPTFLAGDMGGYAMAMEMCEGNEVLGNFGGLPVSLTLGGTVIFTIPFALTVIDKKDRPAFSVGTLAGVITIPLGCLAGGLTMMACGFDLSFRDLLLNLIPVVFPALLIALGLFLIPDLLMKIFAVFGKIITALILIALGLAIFQQQTGITLPFLEAMTEPGEDGMTPILTGLLAVGQIAIVLAGAFPMVEFIKKAFRRPLEAMGQRLSINGESSAALIASMANSIAVFSRFGKMDERGKILNSAFAVSAAFLFGDHLAFSAAVCPEMILPLLITKVVGGVSALILAGCLMPALLKRANPRQNAAEKETL